MLQTPNAALRPDYFPIPDPWRILIDEPCVNPFQKQVFRAAQSFLVALKRLCRIAEGFATLNTDQLAELADAQEQGQTRRHKAISRKLAEKFVLSKFIRDETQAKGNLPEIAEANALHTARKKQLAHRSQSQRKAVDFNPMLAMRQIEKALALETFLVESWLCFPSGAMPGLMFWRNEAITQFWQFHTGQTQFTPDTAKKTRQRLGLLPVSHKSPFVWDVEFRKLNGVIAIAGFNRIGQTVFTGEKRSPQ
jgi:hypothetical protein